MKKLFYSILAGFMALSFGASTPSHAKKSAEEKANRKLAREGRKDGKKKDKTATSNDQTRKNVTNKSPVIRELTH